MQVTKKTKSCSSVNGEVGNVSPEKHGQISDEYYTSSQKHGRQLVAAIIAGAVAQAEEVAQGNTMVMKRPLLYITRSAELRSASDDTRLPKQQLRANTHY